MQLGLQLLQLLLLLSAAANDDKEQLNKCYTF